MKLLGSELRAANVPQIIQSGLHEYLDGLQTKLNTVGESLLQDFFVLGPVESSLSTGGAQH